MTQTNSQAKHMILGQIYTNEVTDPRILQAMAEVPRERFVPDHLRGAAYVDEDLRFEDGRSLMAPMTLAKLLTLSGIAEPSRVLVVGAYNGYAAAVAAKLAHHVVAIDVDEAALVQARKHLEVLHLTNVNAQAVKKMADGYAASAPYDVIIVAGAVEYVPENLGAQLALGGKLVVVRRVAGGPLSDGLGRGVAVMRIGGELQYREHFDAATPLLPGFEAPVRFAL